MSSPAPIDMFPEARSKPEADPNSRYTPRGLIDAPFATASAER